MSLYLKITDKMKSSNSSIKLTLSYNGNKIAEQIVNFDFIKSVVGINPYTIRVTGCLNKLIPAAAKDTITTITLGGRISGNDIAYLRDSLNLKAIDMSEADIVAGPGYYYNDYLTEADIIGLRLFLGMKANTIILPESAKEIGNYAFYQNKKLSKALNDKRIRVRKAGNIAEAALEINGVMQAAQEAARHYQEEVQLRVDEERLLILRKTYERADAILAKAQQEAAAIVARAKKQVNR